MAKKKITKKPVSKRTTRAALDERNERLGNTDAPKPRKPRAQKPKVVVTTEPASKVLWFEGSAAEFLGETQTAPPPPVEYTKVNKNIVDSAWEWINFKLDDAKAYCRKRDSVTLIRDIAFDYPATFGISFCVVLSAVCVGVLYLNRLFHLI